MKKNVNILITISTLFNDKIQINIKRGKMIVEKFNLMQYSVHAILGLIDAEDFVIPEIQRPFVWKRSQVRDLIDSLYNGYPTGYIITWKNPDVRTKDGGKANGKKVLIDGQQRVTALMAAISGKEVLDNDFNKERIKIAFNPLAEDNTKRFAVQDASHLKDKKWIPNIAVVFERGFDPFEFSINYCEANEGVKPNVVNKAITELQGIKNRQIGVIELDASLEIDEVTEIFIRINSKGTALSQSDFVMSKMGADSTHNGNLIRKVVDYFCHLTAKPDFYSSLIKDKEFQESKYADKIKWLANGYDDIYNPGYGDMLRVSFMHQFRRGKLADLVSLLSGRDFITKEFRDDIIEDSYKKLDKGIVNFINQYHFSQFVLSIKGAGFVASKLLNSQMTLDFAYTLYLILLNDSEVPKSQIKRYVQKWFVLSTLTSRYIGSLETQMDRDMRSISEKGFLKFLSEVESSDLSEIFWTITLPQNLETSSINSPAFNTFLAAQINQNCNSMLMNGIKIVDLITISGDVHHIFPKNYLQKNGIKNKIKYNQVANYIYIDTQINKAISDDAPSTYFSSVKEQCKTKNIILGNISNEELLTINLAENCIPNDIYEMTVSDYDDFLQKRRILMSEFIHKYYLNL